MGTAFPVIPVRQIQATAPFILHKQNCSRSILPAFAGKNIRGQESLLRLFIYRQIYTLFFLPGWPWVSFLDSHKDSRPLRPHCLALIKQEKPHSLSKHSHHNKSDNYFLYKPYDKTYANSSVGAAIIQGLAHGHHHGGKHPH